uniref:Uncharacterized protein n=1 Tax=uncultured Leeuwenhoekiella sp. TaxID=487010 RepID=F4MLQ2_9FLAO|nr:hypothetical protein [uncultured bacterium]AOE08673.1 hypothetical protein [uncultured bacterium]CBL80613.1 hypothetical protein S18_1013_0036 [uncultured Leeuwenhoekiella sp.]
MSRNFLLIYKRTSSVDAKESNLNFYCQITLFQCASLALKAAANIQPFLFTKQAKNYIFFKLISNK